MSVFAKLAKNSFRAQMLRKTQAPAFQSGNSYHLVHLLVILTRSVSFVAANQEKIQKWLHTLSNKASTGESRSYCAQLSSLLNFYNKQHVEAIPVG